ncbi:beta-Ala-His dipeptidase [Entomospira culicis]|uniref:Aminoacyl-histidine dipeptidase n=1 Tax=Entomospira culicis TaxID=2719989 RepID=A0A968GDW0_9SPIO|nr:beta-Ala-His dipeptidase [Entomospira culicis]NIZ18517.1 aminoacyl-histidine dipeptidase [Entomospira culicis]NIZ68733.1 aminoacyl-histidine dipeptidase [Entomospira culicis]WDI37329.1 beta-Ala-His dipeptidase [Entomospira culicis]WDI38958.1 beta-Ala-His dipeptidase [Entomospira culicis]
MWSLDFFKELAKVPRPPYQEEKVARFLRDYALARGYQVASDDAGNLLIRVAGAGAGLHKETLVLQAHMDMVCVSEPGHLIDFANEAIEIYEEDGFLHAKGTTLGADNGIGIALAFYCAQLPHHPPLEILITVQEEVGMHGAAAVQRGFFTGRRLINIDNSVEGALINGCAGGNTLELRLPVEHDTEFRAKLLVKVSVQGLTGGHSGIDIHLGRLSSNKVLLDLLQQLEESDMAYRLVEMQAGMARNAIARDGYLVLALANALDKEELRTMKSRLVSGEQEYVAFLLEELTTHTHHPLTKASQDALMTLLKETPHGVMTWANEVSGEVQTSNNLALTQYDGKAFTITTFHRSFLQRDIEGVQQTMRELADKVGAEVKDLGMTAPWAPLASSRITGLMADRYRALYPDATLQVHTVHAGLECGYWMLLDSEMDMISIGPNIYDLHSPQERLDLASLARVERWLEEVMNVL